MKRIGMLTSGGDCQALNATMRGIVKGVCNALEEVELYGFEEGYKGLIYGNYRMLSPKDFSGILTKGGTILGSSRQPFKLMRVPDENGLDILKRLKTDYPNIHVIMLTADTSEEVHAMATEYGAEYFIYKPFSFEHLQAAIKQIL